MRPRTEPTKKITKRSLEVGRVIYPEKIERPATRGDCRGGPRPCLFVGCRYHLFLDVNPETGSIKYNFPDLDPDELLSCCALDVADGGPHTLEEVGDLMNIVRERVRQIEDGFSGPRFKAAWEAVVGSHWQ